MSPLLVIEAVMLLLPSRSYSSFLLSALNICDGRAGGCSMATLARWLSCVNIWELPKLTMLV